MATKTLLLLRHAKSSWDDPQLDDHDRPLNGRGRKAARRIGQLLIDEAITIDLVLCSTSMRTRETASLIFAVSTRSPAIAYHDELYHASPSQMIDLLRQVAEPMRTVMVIGHNPGFDEFLERLTGNEISFPTAGLAKIELQIDRWSLFDDQTNGQLAQFWRPRDLGAD